MVIAGGSDDFQLRRESYSFQLASSRWERGPDLLQPRSNFSEAELAHTHKFQKLNWETSCFDVITLMKHLTSLQMSAYVPNIGRFSGHYLQNIRLLLKEGKMDIYAIQIIVPYS